MSASIVIMAVSTGAAAIALQLRQRSHRLLDAASGGRGHPLGGTVLESGVESVLQMVESIGHRVLLAGSGRATTQATWCRDDPNGARLWDESH